MDEDLFELILQIGTYNESCWYDFSGNEIALPKAWCKIPEFKEE